MAKIKDNPKQLPLPLSFVEGDCFIRCLNTGEVRAIRDRYVDSDGDVINATAYTDGFTETLVVDEEGKQVFAEGTVAKLFEPWREELVRAVMEVYSAPPQKAARRPRLPRRRPSAPRGARGDRGSARLVRGPA
jgi:hypothetical protein